MQYDTFLRLIQQNDRGSGLSRGEIFTRASESGYFELSIIAAMIEDGVKQGDLEIRPHASEPRYSVSASTRLRIHKERNAENMTRYIQAALSAKNQSTHIPDNKKNIDWNKICAIATIIGIIVTILIWRLSEK